MRTFFRLGGIIEPEHFRFLFPRQEGRGQIHPDVFIPKTDVGLRRLAVSVQTDDLRTDDADGRIFIQLTHQCLHHS